MAKRGRPPVLDEIKRREILAILSVGCSRSTAADYVGCSVATIQKTAERDPEFAEQLRRAESRAEIYYLQALQKAAQKEQYWRAAAWLLERKLPDRYAKRKPDTLTVQQVEALLEQFAEGIVRAIPVAKYRKEVLKQLDRLLTQLGYPARLTGKNLSAKVDQQ